MLLPGEGAGEGPGEKPGKKLSVASSPEHGAFQSACRPESAAADHNAARTKQPSERIIHRAAT